MSILTPDLAIDAARFFKDGLMLTAIFLYDPLEMTDWEWVSRPFEIGVAVSNFDIVGVRSSES